MAKKPPLIEQLTESQSTLDLPDDILHQMGRLIAIFAAIENMMGLIPATLLGITPMESRIAVRSPRMKDVCEMIASLARIHEFKLTQDLSKLGTALKDLEEMRDWFGHGIWARTGDGLGVRVIMGSWTPAGLKLPPGKQSIQRRVVPAVVPVTAAAIAKIADAALDLIPLIHSIHEEIRQKLGS